MRPDGICVEGVLRLLKSLEEAKAIGLNQISPSALRRCADAVASYLFIILNKSLLEAALPVSSKVD